MKTILLITSLFLGAATTAKAASGDVMTNLQWALFQEEANHNFDAAIQAYKAVVAATDKDRRLAVTAIFRLGECYRKEGDTNDASICYKRVLTEFPDQPAYIKLSVERMADMGMPLAKAAVPTLSRGARVQERQLLEQEIKLLEQQLKDQQALIQTGQAPHDSALRTQRDILELKRQVVALDLGTAQTTAGQGNEATSESADVARIQALVQNSPDLINAPQKNGETLLEAAAGKGQLDVATLLLNSGAAVNGLRQPGLTPLHFAAANGHLAMVKLLLSKGTDPNAQTSAGVTPLDLAALKGYEEVGKALLDAGARPNVATSSQERVSKPDLSYSWGPVVIPLHLAASSGYEDFVKMLIAKGANVNAVDGSGRTPLSDAAAGQYLQTVKTLLAAKADPNLGTRDLPLASAAYNGNTNMAEVLLKAGANPNLVRGFAWPVGRFSMAAPLAIAIMQYNAPTVRILIHFKADPNAPDSNGNPLIYDALADPPTLKALLDGGADPNKISTDPSHQSALFQAVLSRNDDAIRLLLEHGADTAIADSHGNTPLQIAAGNDELQAAELLVKAGADVNARNEDGKTPSHLAAEDGHADLARLLLESKANPNAQDNSGDTPLYDAAAFGRVDIVRLLLQYHADPNVQDKQGQTPLTLAQQRLSSPNRFGRPQGTPHEYASIVDLLLHHGAMKDVPNMNAIELRRPSTGFSQVIFTRTTNDWNHFTLLDLIGVEYGLLAANSDMAPIRSFPANGPSSRGYADLAMQGFRGVVAYPDFARIQVRRPAPDLKSWTQKTVDLSAVLSSGVCSNNVELKWGDVVEITEHVHALSQVWGGFTREQLSNLFKCLSREVSVTVAGQTTKLILQPEFNQYGFQRAAGGMVHGVNEATFWLKPALWSSNVALSSSDLSHIKVMSIDPATGQKREWVIDCSQNKPAPQFWLRNGDVITVPDKP